MDISQTIPFLLANIVRFLLQRVAKGGKTYVLILPLVIGLTGVLIFFEFGALPAEADFINGVLVYQEETPGLVIFQGNTLAPASNSPILAPQPVRKIKVVVTAYSSTPWETDGSPYITASGNWVREGIIANNLLPFGTQVRMPEIFGDRVFVVEDRMNSRKGYYQIDIWFPSYWEALNFGAKRTYIEVLEG